jgi:starch-binding outer membrane protein, SusD/RagB family
MKIKILFITIILFVLSVSCDKVLDTKPMDIFSEDDVWNDINLAQGFVFNTYRSAWSLYVSDWDGGTYTNEDWTDNVGDYGANSVADETLDRFYDAGFDQYASIRQCNLIIEKVTASTGILEEDKPRLIGEAEFLRAYINYFLVKKFGHFIKVDKVLTPEENLKLPLATIKECYDFVLADLDDAAAKLPDDAEKGRACKSAAWALKSEVALQAAAYVGTDKLTYYTAAKNACESIINAGKYVLDPNYNSLFNNYSYAVGSSEIILGDFRSKDNTYFYSTPMQWLCPNSGAQKQKVGTWPTLVETFEGWIGRYPTQELVDDYLVNDDDGIAKKWNQTALYQNYLVNGGYISDFMYKNRDKRFYASITYDSTKYFNNLITTRINGNMSYATIYGTWGVTQSSYFFIKGMYQDKKVWYSDATPYSLPIFRLGRVYMNYAESLLRLNQIPQAIEAFNQTREIHGGLPALATSLTSEEAWNFYKIERRVELLLEDDRYVSLLRWGKEADADVIDELNQPLHGLEITEDGKSFSIINLPFDDQRKFSAKRYLFPIPENQRQLNENLGEQNPGW